MKVDEGGFGCFYGSRVILLDRVGILSTVKVGEGGVSIWSTVLVTEVMMWWWHG